RAVTPGRRPAERRRGAGAGRPALRGGPDRRVRRPPDPRRRQPRGPRADPRPGRRHRGVPARAGQRVEQGRRPDHRLRGGRMTVYKAAEEPRRTAPEPQPGDRSRSRRGPGIPKTIWAMVVPAFVLFFVFHTIPVLTGIFFSFTNFAGYGEWQFVGF